MKTIYSLVDQLRVNSPENSPTDVKFASCSDDGTVRIWDFYTRTEEKILRGHGADVKQIDWHPSKVIGLHHTTRPLFFLRKYRECI